jgi:hypothetical protein
MDFDKRLNACWMALRIGIGSAAFLAGLDKFFNLLTNWEQYLSPFMAKLLPFSAATFMRGVGVIEMIVGLTVLLIATRLGSYVASVWLLAIAANLVTTGMYFDVAVRDVLMAIAAFTLGQLTQVREESMVRTTHPRAVENYAG